MLKGARAYLSTQVTTSTQGDLLVMLYDTAIKHLRNAIEKMRAKDVAAKGLLITKALAILGELQGSLNMEQGGEISKNLFQLYNFCNTRLLQANLRQNQEMVQDVINILNGLRQAFAEILPSQGAASLTQPEAGAGDAAATAQADTPVDASAAAMTAATQAAVNASRPGLSLGGRPAADMTATYQPSGLQPGALQSSGLPSGALQPGALQPGALQPGALAAPLAAPAPSPEAAAAPAAEAPPAAPQTPTVPPLLPSASEAQAPPSPPAGSANVLRFRAANAYATTR